jgi:hypothetical protein
VVSTCQTATNPANTTHLPPISAARRLLVMVVVTSRGLRPTS